MGVYGQGEDCGQLGSALQESFVMRTLSALILYVNCAFAMEAMKQQIRIKINFRIRAVLVSPAEGVLVVMYIYVVFFIEQSRNYYSLLNR